MRTHYIDLTPEGAVTYEVFARVLKGVHLANVEEHALAVDWPEWQPIRGQFGSTMRVLGTAEGLEHLLGRLAPLITHSLLKCSEGVKQIPASATGTHWYRRDRKADKSTPSHNRRLERRAAARGEVYVPPRVPRSPALHALRLQSESTGQSYYMDIRRQGASDEPDRQRPTPDVYGFGVVIPSF